MGLISKQLSFRAAARNVTPERVPSLLLGMTGFLLSGGEAKVERAPLVVAQSLVVSQPRFALQSALKFKLSQGHPWQKFFI
jgi:hypothetical protein